MKTLKLLFFSLIISSFANIVKADGPKTIKLTKTYAISAYVNAVVKGDLTAAPDVIDNNAQFRMLRGKQILSFSKEEMLKFVRDNQGVIQDCTTTTTQLNVDSVRNMIRVDMKYRNFTRSNYVTLTNIGGEWKITDVYSVFK